MNGTRLTGLILLFCAVGCSTLAEDYTRTMVMKGLPAKVTVRVRDPDGNPVPDAPVKFVFGFANKTDLNIVKGNTDANGMASGEGLGNDKVVIHVDKTGWYRPECDYSLRGSGKSYQSGRWEPWNPTLDITLYPKVNRRQAPKGRSCYYEHLEQGTAYGFDMLKTDFVLPGRKGETVDFSFTTSGSYTTMRCEGSKSVKTYATNILEITFLNDGDGLVKMKKRLDSEFQFTYLAPETGCEQKVRFNSDFSPQHRGSTFISDNNEYLIFRISRKDAVSGEIKRYYGIMTRLESRSGNGEERTFDIWYYLNPIPGDRNIEYGP